ncbi:hypothetical protein ACFSE1_10395 [Rhizobium helianthi]|uniref:Uncharacterized protein n=1 Tax=Rhizobium helianthi TaxID=1132695 RepID=A0ABW4M3J0_9HYPH
MILEALNYGASWPLTPATFRPHVSSSVRLWARARRCAKHWAAHEAQSKAHMLAALKELKQRRTAVVLGSGLLRDVPIRELIAAFDTVVLVDLVHLASIRAWAALNGKKKLRLISRDLSGLDVARTGQMPEPLSFLRQVPYLDFVVSANLLSQIGVGARRVLEAERRDADAILPLMIRAHLEGLAALPCKSCIVTDVDYEMRNRQGDLLEQGDLLAGVAPPKAVSTWEWTVVPFGEMSRDSIAVHRVIAA